MLRTTGAAFAGAIVLGGATGVGGAQAAYRVIQDGNCTPLVPLQGDVPVEEFYDYKAPKTHYSGAGDIVDLQDPHASRFFLYTGPDGVTSLVFIHGKVIRDDPVGGGSASFDIKGVPPTAEWAVRDDDYGSVMTTNPQGEEVLNTQLDQWDIEETQMTVNWTWGTGNTDGAVLKNLEDLDAIVIENSFNEDTPLYGKKYTGKVDKWEALTGDMADPQAVPLEMGVPITIEPGSC